MGSEMYLRVRPASCDAQQVPILHGSFRVATQVGPQQMWFGQLEVPESQGADAQEPTFDDGQVGLCLQIGDEVMVLTLFKLV
ncbi:hypothetical protein CBQ26_11780 [Deinococcus indicus]|uniref:Uncharacterized protein n=1 Tax=Deinococcus indicus TaxID=223556 RepID=A0A246BKG5_9DEIO|nr:hypothetical protein CBQ26_11780 [Deinococcus indicus]